MDHSCYLCLVFLMLSRLFIAALWSSAGKGLTSWLFFVMFNCAFVTFQYGILGQVWYLIVSIPDLCRLSFFANIQYSILCKTNIAIFYMGQSGHIKPRGYKMKRNDWLLADTCPQATNHSALFYPSFITSRPDLIFYFLA